jgi:hypothetical protein
MECLPLWPTYIGENGRTLGKTHGIKVRCYWEHTGNLMGTHWELEGDTFGNEGIPKKILLSPKTWKKKFKALWVHAEPSHWLHGISMFQNCSSPFLAWANTPIINWGYLFDFISRLTYMYTHK